MHPTRRQALLSTLFGAGSIGLRALASGIPAAVLLHPGRARGDMSCFDPAKAQYLILSTSDHGDPLNVNVPGTYADPNIIHPQDPRMAPTALTLSGRSYVAAKPWSTLPQSVLDRTAFIHHTTLTNSHGDQRKVMSLMGRVARQEMLVSLYAKKLAPCLGTLQTEPVSLGAYNPLEALKFDGRNLPMLTPKGLAATLANPTGPLNNLQKMRDRDLSRLHELFKQNGTPSQLAFLDRYATSQTQLRSISQDLLTSLSSISDNGPASQIIAAVALVRMNVSPVISIHIPFGGDNHQDVGFAKETSETVSGIASVAQLMQALASAGLSDRVTFMSMNVFGRTLKGRTDGTDGRDHHAGHHCTVAIGKPFRGGVYGGVVPAGIDYSALPINSATGAGEANGDIAYADTLASLGVTVGTALGVDPAVLNDQISGGKVIMPMLG